MQLTQSETIRRVIQDNAPPERFRSAALLLHVSSCTPSRSTTDPGAAELSPYVDDWVPKSGEGKGGVGRRGLWLKNTSYFSLREDTPADKHSLFIWATRARAHTRTHNISFLSISLYFSPTNKKHSPHFSTSKLGSSASKRPREGACGTAFLQLTIHVTELSNNRLLSPLSCYVLPLGTTINADVENALTLRISPQIARKEVMAGGRILRAVSEATGLKV